MPSRIIATLLSHGLSPPPAAVHRQTPVGAGISGAVSGQPQWYLPRPPAATAGVRRPSRDAGLIEARGSAWWVKPSGEAGRESESDLMLCQPESCSRRHRDRASRQTLKERGKRTFVETGIRHEPHRFHDGGHGSKTAGVVFDPGGQRRNVGRCPDIREDFKNPAQASRWKTTPVTGGEPNDPARRRRWVGESGTRSKDQGEPTRANRLIRRSLHRGGVETTQIAPRGAWHMHLDRADGQQLPCKPETGRGGGNVADCRGL